MAKFVIFLKFDKFKMGKTNDDFEGSHHVHLWLQPNPKPLLHRVNNIIS